MSLFNNPDQNAPAQAAETAGGVPPSGPDAGAPDAAAPNTPDSDALAPAEHPYSDAFKNYATAENANFLREYGMRAARHGLNAAVATDLVDFVREAGARQEAAARVADGESYRAAQTALQESYSGHEYGQTMTAIESFISSAPRVVQESLRYHVLFDPEGAKWLAQLVRNPQLSKSVGGNMAHETNEKREIEKMMGNRNSEYWKGADAPRLQARYRDIANNAPAQSAIPTDASEINSEIATLERYMRTDRRAYFKDEIAQKRYRDLVAARGGR